MQPVAKLFCCTGIMLAAGLAQAQIFVCKDAAGRYRDIVASGPPAQ